MDRIASLASSMGITAPISGLIPPSITRRIMLFISSSVPMIEPMTVIFSLKRRSKFALGSIPVVTPKVTTVPPVTAPIGAAHHRIDHDRRSVIERACSIISQDHRVGNSLRVRSEPSQREDVVPVETRVGHLHPDPPFGNVRFGPISQDKTGHGII